MSSYLYTFQDQHSTKWSSLTLARKKKKKKTAKRRRSFSAARTADPTNLKLLLTFTAILTAHCSFEGIAGWPALQLALLHCAVLEARKSFRDASSIFFIITSNLELSLCFRNERTSLKKEIEIC